MSVYIELHLGGAMLPAAAAGPLLGRNGLRYRGHITREAEQQITKIMGHDRSTKGHVSFELALYRSRDSHRPIRRCKGTLTPSEHQSILQFFF